MFVNSTQQTVMENANGRMYLILRICCYVVLVIFVLLHEVFLVAARGHVHWLNRGYSGVVAVLMLAVNDRRISRGLLATARLSY